MQPVFDGHNDVLLRLWMLSRKGIDPVDAFMNGKRSSNNTALGQLDLPRARKGGLTGGLCATFIPSTAEKRQAQFDPYPMAAPLEHGHAFSAAEEFLAIARRIEEAQGWTICTSVADIRKAMKAGRFAAVLHMEGAEPINIDLAELHTFHQQGLRSLGPVWSRHNRYAHGVPFAFNQTPDTGPGITTHGLRLIHECNRLGIMVDVAHLNEAGFWDVARYSDAPLVASHSNVHSLSPAARNLTDKQLDAIAERNGLVGVNFAVNMLRADGLYRTNTSLDVIRRHLDYLIERMGPDCVALGSDFDGAYIPEAIHDASGLPNLTHYLKTHGYDDSTLRAICSENWLNLLERTWKE